MEGFESSEEKKETHEEILADKIVAFIMEHSMQYQEMFNAYQLALGFQKEEVVGQITESVLSLAALMKEFLDAKYPVNTLVEIINEKNLFDNGEKEFEDLVEKLLISEREKVLLHSIVSKRRAGTLEVNILEPETTIKINTKRIVHEEGAAQNSIAYLLYVALKEFEGSKLEISFDEE